MSRAADDRARRIRRRGAGFPRFFTKQLLVFLLLAFIVIVLDLLLYAYFAVYESDLRYGSGQPNATVRAVRDGFVAEHDGVLTLDDEAMAALDEQDAWALVIADDGVVTWEYDVPADVPRFYTPTDTALMAHYGYVADCSVFIWDCSEGLLVVGFPEGTYWHISASFPVQTIQNIPLYIALIFGADLLVFFLYFVWSRRKVVRAVEPLTGAIDDLAHGRPAQLRLAGDLREVGDSVMLASDVMQRKDSAREQWIRGVSHDIRTPLALIVGQAEGIAGSDDVPQPAREKAAAIRSQAFKIKDLVVDLNTASQLEYDAQPVHTESVPLARLLREVLAEQLNASGFERYPLELDVAPDAADVVLQGDPRLLRRALENLLANARLHNGGGCSIAVRLRREEAVAVGVCDGDGDRSGGKGADGVGSGAMFAGLRERLRHASAPATTPCVVVEVADDGAGATPEQLAALESRLARARLEGASQPDSEGHGLGLVLVDRIVRAHSGSLTVQSAEGKGFAVQLRLPLTGPAATLSPR